MITTSLAVLQAVLLSAYLASAAPHDAYGPESAKSKAEVRQSAPASATTQIPKPDQNDVTMLFHSDPNPPKVGENKFEVMVKDPAGKAVKDADVSLGLSMPNSRGERTSETKNTVQLKHYGDGIYRGAGPVMMAGPWIVTIVVKRDGKQVGTRALPLAASSKHDSWR